MNRTTILEVDLERWRPPAMTPRLIGGAVAGLLVLVLLLGSFYQIQPEEIGLIVRFGKHARTTPPGLHLKVPFVEQVYKVPVQRQLKQEFGFRTAELGARTRFAQEAYQGESLMLTGDLNVAVVEWIVQYRVSDPYSFLFKVRNVEETFRNINEAVMRQVVGDRTVTEVLTVGRQEVEIRAQEMLQEIANQYETGITVDQVVLQDVTPPDPVKPSWDEVNQAQQQKDRLINEAQAEYNQVIPRARGEAEQAILQAEGYSMERINQAEGDAARFIAIHEAYRLAPEVTRKRMYLESMQKVLPRLGGKVLMDKDAQGVMPMLPVESLRSFTGEAFPRRETAQ